MDHELWERRAKESDEYKCSITLRAEMEVLKKRILEIENEMISLGFASQLARINLMEEENLRALESYKNKDKGES